MNPVVVWSTFTCTYWPFWGSPSHSVVKNRLPKQETQVQFLHWEDPLEKEMATCPSILVWKTLWIEEPGGLPCMGQKQSDTTQKLNNKWPLKKKICSSLFSIKKRKNWIYHFFILYWSGVLMEYYFIFYLLVYIQSLFCSFDLFVLKRIKHPQFL